MDTVAGNSTAPAEFYVSPFIPPILSVVCSCVAGLTSFGDAILFHVLWAVVAAIGWISSGRRETLTKAVLYLSFIPIANILPFIYVARHSLLRCAPYGVIMATTGVAMVNVGSYMLFFGDLTVLKVGVGLFFIIFSVAKLTLAFRQMGIERRKALTGADASVLKANESSGILGSGDTTVDISSIHTANMMLNGSSRAALSEGMTPSVLQPLSPRGDDTSSYQVSPAFEDQETTASHIAAQTNRKMSNITSPSSIDGNNICAEADWVDPLSARAATADIPPAQLPGRLETHAISASFSAQKSTNITTTVTEMKPLVLFGRFVIQPISPAFSVLKTMALLLVTGSVSGLLGGMFGTGGPPQMIAFSTLRVDKDTLRGVSVVYGSLELAMRVYAFTSGSGNVFDAGEWKIYLGIVIAAWIGFALGTWWRARVDTDFIIRILLALVFASSAIMLGALDDAMVAAVFAVFAAGWATLLAVLYYRGIECAMFSHTLRWMIPRSLVVNAAPASSMHVSSD